MGVYIKGIEMPKENEAIELLIRNDGIVEGVKVIFSNDDDELTTLIEMEQAKATYISEPHGRLIDESTIMDVYYEKIVHDDGRFKFPMTKIVGTDAPTIIEGVNNGYIY